MEETVTTTADVTVEQTTPEVTETTQPEETQTIEETVTKEPEKTETETTETESQEPVKDWEKIAKDNQASFTKISQEKAELLKRIEDLEAKAQPKIVQEGKINPDFEQKYQFDVDNKEFLAYDNLARQLEPETRATVENLLNEAKGLYSTNKRAYESKLAEIKDYFRSDIVEHIALEKQQAIREMKSEFDKAIAQDKQEKANKVAQAIEAVPELKELVVQESENYSPEVFGIVKQMFDFTGNVDIEATSKAISKIKELGVKEYLAKQNAEKEKAQANVPTGETVVQKQSTGIPTRDEMIANPSLYEKAVKKYGMEKVDAVIMKG